MRTLAITAFCTAILLPSTLNAQTSLPADSMELGRKYMGFILDREADSIFVHMSAEQQERLGSPDGIRDHMTQLDQLGTLTEVLEEKYVRRNGAAQFWHTANYSDTPEPFLMRLVIDSEGVIVGVGMGPASQAPPTDDDPTVL